MRVSKKICEKLASRAGIELNGSAPHDIIINDERAYSRIIFQGSLGFGESYMDGWWDCEDMPEMTARFLKAKAKPNSAVRLVINLMARLANLQNRKKSLELVKRHFNEQSKEIFQNMLGKTMAYTCGYWKKAKNLDQAQINKFDLICKKLDLRKGDRVLDIGAGWGGLARHMAEKYGCHVTAVTISDIQAEYGRDVCKGLPVEFVLCDYRDVKKYNPGREQFDKIVAIGICEHIGPKNYRSFLELVHGQLKPEGLFMLHTIGSNYTQYNCDPWYDRYIFPNGVLPSLSLLTGAMERLFVVEDLHNFGHDYYPTLLAWWDNFEEYWDRDVKGRSGELSEDDERFYRMWRYYILGVSGAFKTRYDQLWQMVLSKAGIEGGYVPVR